MGRRGQNSAVEKVVTLRSQSGPGPCLPGQMLPPKSQWSGQDLHCWEDMLMPLPGVAQRATCPSDALF